MLANIGLQVDAYTAGQVSLAQAPLLAQLASAQLALTAAQNAATADTTIITGLQATIVQLRAELAKLKPVSYNAEVATNYTGAAKTLALELVKQQAGFTGTDPDKPPLGDYQKFFSGGGNSFATSMRTYQQGWFKGDWPSFMGEQWVQAEAAQLLAYLQTILGKSITGAVVSIDQEPQVNWDAHGLTAPVTTVQSRAWWQQNATTLAGMIKAAGLAGQVLQILDLTQYWSVENVSRTFAGNDYTAARGIPIDLIAGDCYTTLAEAKTADRMFGWLVKGSQDLGIGACVPEWGIQGDMNDPAALALAESYVTYLDDNSDVFVYATEWNAGQSIITGTAVGKAYDALIHRG